MGDVSHSRARTRPRTAAAAGGGLLHREALLVVAARDAEDVALKLVAEDVALHLLRHALVVKDGQLLLVVDVKDLRGGGGAGRGAQGSHTRSPCRASPSATYLPLAREGVRDIELHPRLPLRVREGGRGVRGAGSEGCAAAGGWRGGAEGGREGGRAQR